MIFETERLIIRNYRDEDRDIMFTIAAEPETRRFHTRVVSRANTDGFIDKQIASLNSVGCGYAVVERKIDGAVVGSVGMRPMTGDMPLPPEVKFDIGWMLDPLYFGHGYATEAARGWLAHDFRGARSGAAAAYTPASNIPSINVMQRIGMIRDQAMDFDHPRVEAGHPLRRQVVYSASR